MMNTHVVLLGGELIPNVIGALHDHADRILPVLPPGWRRQVDDLQASLSAAGARTEVLDPVEVVPFDLEDCLATFRRIGREHPGALFNWTGGTRVMSYAARRVAEESAGRALFVRSNGREILLEDLAAGTSRVDITDSTRLGLNLLAHLRAAGQTVEAVDTPAAFLARYTPHPDLIVAANAILDANPSERADLFQLAGAENQPVTPRRLNSGFLYILRRAQLIQPGVGPGEFFLSAATTLSTFYLESAQQANARFLRASYLEVFLWAQIHDRCGLNDVGWGIRVNPGEQGRTAELDVAVSGDGRLLLLEAKTNVELTRLSDVIEEQAARCRRIGGAAARWVLYVHKFRDEHLGPESPAIIAAQEARAREYGGSLLWHDQLNELPQIVSRLLEEPAGTP